MFFCFFSLAAIGINAEETITVAVSGYGATPEAAEKVPYKKQWSKAVERWSMLRHSLKGELIKDEVLSYSDGFVQSVTTLSGPEKMRTLVFSPLPSRQKCCQESGSREDAKITTSAVAGGYRAQAVSKISNVEGRDMLAKVC